MCAIVGNSLYNDGYLTVIFILQSIFVKCSEMLSDELALCFCNTVDVEPNSFYVLSAIVSFASL